MPQLTADPNAAVHLASIAAPKVARSSILCDACHRLASRLSFCIRTRSSQRKKGSISDCLTVRKRNGWQLRERFWAGILHSHGNDLLALSFSNSKPTEDRHGWRDTRRDHSRRGMDRRNDEGVVGGQPLSWLWGERARYLASFYHLRAPTLI